MQTRQMHSSWLHVAYILTKETNNKQVCFLKVTYNSDNCLKAHKAGSYVQVHTAGKSQSPDFLLDVGYTTQSCYRLPFTPPAQGHQGRSVTCILNSGAALPWSRCWADLIPCVQIAKEKARLEMHLPCILHTLMLSLTKLLAECRCWGVL